MSSTTTSYSVSRKSRKEKRNKKNRNKNTQSRKSTSVPEYRVEEDHHGRLVNTEKRLIWPSKKPIPTEDTLSAISQTESADYDLISVNNCAESDAFIGGATAAEAEKSIGYRSFVLYYRMPDDGTIPYVMPLMLVYRSSNDLHYHFTISQRKQYDTAGRVTRSFFKVECGDSLDFLSLESLIRHYETFVYHDVCTGSMETFPVGSKEGSVYDVYK